MPVFSFSSSPRLSIHSRIDAITKGFIRDNYSSQKGKGTHDGLARLKLQMVTYYRRYGTAEGR